MLLAKLADGLFSALDILQAHLGNDGIVVDGALGAGRKRFEYQSGQLGIAGTKTTNRGLAIVVSSSSLGSHCFAMIRGFGESVVWVVRGLLC